MSQQQSQGNSRASGHSQHNTRYCQAEEQYPGHHSFADIHYDDGNSVRPVAEPSRVGSSPPPARSPSPQRNNLPQRPPVVSDPILPGNSALEKVRSNMATMLDKVKEVERELAEMERLARSQIRLLEDSIANLRRHVTLVEQNSAVCGSCRER
jgi:hypothetical protein